MLDLPCLSRYRVQHGVPATSWDPTLAAQAQVYVNTCPFGHSGTAGVGENMAWGYTDFNAVVDAWYDEVREGLGLGSAGQQSEGKAGKGGRGRPHQTRCLSCQ